MSTSRWFPRLQNARQQLSAYRQEPLLFLVVSYLLWASVALRWIGEYIEQNHPLTGLVSAMLALFGILLGLEPLLTRGIPWRAHLYLLFQTGLVFVATLFYFQLDFFAILFLPLCGQAMFLFPRRTAIGWVIVLSVVMFVGQIIQFGWPGGLPFFLLYFAGLVFVAAFSILMLQAQAARQHSEVLLGELRDAHQQLQQYAGQAEELAVARERNRLARELHDSVAQTLYGLTLQSEAASRKLAAGDTGTVEAYLREFRESARQTLQETRLLIYELRPPLVEQEGLPVALLTRLEAVEQRSGLSVEADLPEIERPPLEVEVGLYRIAQEALNNTLKHAGAQQVGVSLTQEEGLLRLVVRDDGCGFEPGAVNSGGGMGLQNMRERAAQLGGKLELTSAPGAGTTLEVEVPYA
jgi:signal transduction histidine kinase